MINLSFNYLNLQRKFRRNWVYSLFLNDKFSRCVISVSVVASSIAFGSNLLPCLRVVGSASGPSNVQERERERGWESMWFRPVHDK